jgi:hypothetical protein
MGTGATQVALGLLGLGAWTCLLVAVCVICGLRGNRHIVARIETTLSDSMKSKVELEFRPSGGETQPAKSNEVQAPISADMVPELVERPTGPRLDSPRGLMASESGNTGVNATP